MTAFNRTDIIYRGIMHKVCLNTGCHREQRLRQHHTRARYVTLPLCTFEHMQHSPRLHSGGSFTCCNRIYVSLRREMREPRRVPSVQTGCRVPLPLIYMCGAPGVRLMPGEMQYDILTHADAEICHCDSAGTRREKNSESEAEATGCLGQIGLFTPQLIACACLLNSTWQMPRGPARGSPSSSMRNLTASRGYLDSITGISAKRVPRFLDSLLSARQLFLFFILSSRLSSLRS